MGIPECTTKLCYRLHFICGESRINSSNKADVSYLGAESLVRHLIKENVPVAVASGSSKKDFKTKTSRHREFFDQFKLVVLGDDLELKNGKPAPDQFLLTASRFSNPPQPETCLVFEDSPNGVLAAKAAGMGVVLVPDERLEKHLFNEPSSVLKSLEDFVPEQWGLPAYKGQ